MHLLCYAKDSPGKVLFRPEGNNRFSRSNPLQYSYSSSNYRQVGSERNLKNTITLLKYLVRSRTKSSTNPRVQSTSATNANIPLAAVQPTPTRQNRKRTTFLYCSDSTVRLNAFPPSRPLHKVLAQSSRSVPCKSADAPTDALIVELPFAKRASATATPKAVAAGYQGASLEGGGGGGRFCPFEACRTGRQTGRHRVKQGGSLS